MMDWTDRHARYLLRLISRRALLYTEMVTIGAILHGDRARWLAFDPAEHPVTLQLGGSDPDDLARAAEQGQAFGYDEINLNVGCPSDRVRTGRFGACLMAEPELVARCVAEMRAVVDLPVTVKTRIGIDDRDNYEFLRQFVDTVAAAGCRTFVIHARKAWLTGLSPKQNREVPPLQYDRVHRLKAERPGLEIIVNGGLISADQVSAQLAKIDGVMIGREAYQNPWCLVALQQAAFGDQPTTLTRQEVLDRFIHYIDRQLAAGVPLNAMTRHLLGLFNGLPGARAWRRHLSEAAHHCGAGLEVIRQARKLVRDRADSAPEDAQQAA